jgi:BlaI family penicillinase repressor
MRLSDSEWQIMNALWQGHPATARELAEKGAVAETKRGNTSIYAPLVARDEARRNALVNLLDHAFGGAVQPLLAFLARDRELTEKQRKELERILAEENDKRGDE